MNKKGNRKRQYSDKVRTEYGDKYFDGKYYINAGGYFAEEQDIIDDDYVVEDGIAIGTDLQTINKTTKDVKYWVAYEGIWYER